MCALRSSLSCISAAEVKSAAIEMNVSSLLVPSVSIMASANEVCKNTNVVFTASAVNGGDHPVYEWEKNQVIVGAGSDIYTDNTLVDGDIIICKLMSNERCITEQIVSGNPVRISVYDDPVVALDKKNYLCEGGSRVLDAGTFSSYEWTTDATSRSITVTNTGIYSVTVTDQHGCKGTDYVDISTIRPLPKNFLPGDKAICPYDELLLSASSAFNQYGWSTGSSQPSVTVSKPGLYWLEVQDNYGCAGKDSIVLLPKDCPEGFFMPNAFTPNNDGKNDNLKPVLLGNVAMYQFRIYNRWGQIVFSSSDITKGWDGTFNGVLQEAHVFIWTCSYQFSGQAAHHEKGTVMLIK
jgi:gliding motility-associated-like protein